MKALFISFLVCSATHANATFCTRWSAATKIGQTDRNLSEASGIVVSTALPDRMYSHNDSGSEASFFQAGISGSNSREIRVTGGSFRDVEDVAYAPCPGKQASKCIFLADIGDNSERRSNVTIVVIEETDSTADNVRPLAQISLTYPDGSHNAEAFAVHPNGDFYIITKEKRSPQTVFRFTARDVAASKAVGQALGTLDIGQLAGISDTRISGMDMIADGSKFVVLTYENAMEFNIDLAKVSNIRKDLKNGIDFSVAKIPQLEQQEAIAYLPGGESFIYTSEGGSQDILRVDCLR